MKLGSIVIDAKDIDTLGKFYENFLGWDLRWENYKEMRWGILTDPSNEGTPIVFQEEPDFKKPVWPTTPQEQQQMLHLDFYVSKEEYQEKISLANSIGAVESEVQFTDEFRVMIDPAGHPFCIIHVPETSSYDFNPKDFIDSVIKQRPDDMKSFFSEDATIRWYDSDEQFTLSEYIRANCEYPGNWDYRIDRTDKSHLGYTTAVQINNGELTFNVVSFITLNAGGKITLLEEYFSELGEIPQWRKDLKLGTRIELK